MEAAFENDVFYSEQPYPSWSISEETNWIWTPPIPRPETDPDADPQDRIGYEWNEEDQTWDLVE